MKYTLLLYEGKWKPRLSRRAVRTLLDELSLDGEWTVVDYAFVEPDQDVALAIELWTVSEWSDAEHVRDALIEEFLWHFEPEFESMIEVKVDYAC